jgi:hypothetical protein
VFRWYDGTPRRRIDIRAWVVAQNRSSQGSLPDGSLTDQGTLQLGDLLGCQCRFAARRLSPSRADAAFSPAVKANRARSNERATVSVAGRLGMTLAVAVLPLPWVMALLPSRLTVAVLTIAVARPRVSRPRQVVRDPLPAVFGSARRNPHCG